MNNSTTHGQSTTQLYTVWRNIFNRCNNPNNPDYKHYGARGIKRCHAWDNYQNFHNWAMANGYDNKLTIERIDNSLGYAPGNCTWVTRKVQANNRRTSAINGYVSKAATSYPSYYTPHRIKTKTAKYIGVHVQNGRFISKTRVNGKDKHLGSYDTAEEAARVRDDYVIKHGLKRKMNF